MINDIVDIVSVYLITSRQIKRLAQIPTPKITINSTGTHNDALTNTNGNEPSYRMTETIQS